MLPQALQRSEAPAEALAIERLERVRRLGEPVRARLVRDPPARPAEPPGEVHVLGERVDLEAAHADHGRAPPSADRARHDGDGVERSEEHTSELQSLAYL